MAREPREMGVVLDGVKDSVARREAEKIDRHVYLGHVEGYVETGIVFFDDERFDGFKFDRMHDGSLKLYGIQLKKETRNG